MENDDLVIETWNGTGLAEIEKRSMPSDSGDASHAAWFNPLFNEFRTAIDCSDYAGREAQEALLCVQLINMAYRSAEQGSRELPLAHVLRD